MSQNAQNTMRIPAPSDGQVLTFMGNLIRHFKGGAFNASLSNRSLGDFQSTQAFTESYAETIWDETYILNSLRYSSPNSSFHVEFHRHVTEFGERNTTHASQWECEIYIFGSRNQISETEDIVSSWNLAGQFKDETTISQGKSVRNQGDIGKIFAKQVASLTDLHNRIIYDAEKARIAAENRLEERQAALTTSYEERRLLLERQTDEKQQALSSEEKRLEEHRRALDDRGHMHARRQLRNDITADLKMRLEKPGVSSETRLLRMGVILTTIAGIVAFGLYAAFASWDLHVLLTTRGPVYTLSLVFAAARFILPAAAAAGLLFYLLGWLKQLHADDVRAERDLERYRYDIDRATWAIETVLEVQGKEEAGEVPLEWIEGVTRNLFTQSEDRSEDLTALEALGSLLNVAAKAEIGPGGTKIEIAKGGLKKISKSGVHQAEG